MKKSYIAIRTYLAALALTFAVVGFTGCDDDDSDSPVVGVLSMDASQNTKTVSWDEVETSVAFNATSDWTAKMKTTADWLKLTYPKGKAGDVKMPLLLTKNDTKYQREAVITVTCGDGSQDVKIVQTGNPDAVEILTMSPADIPNYDKYYTPASGNPHFEKGAEGMLRSDSYYSWFRMKQSEHFFVFWSPEFGDDPNAESVKESMRIDVDDLLQKAEQFYKTNVEILKMVTVGQGKSQLDNYKMEIYLIYQDEWLATGSGYDNVIGALWVNPATCKPVGSTIAHEIGHSFQYQVYADKLLNGEADDLHSGFRYGFGPNGDGGCAYWEQCAQWQSFQDYPAEAFTQTYGLWLKNSHRHFNHEWMRYQSVWFQYYMTNKHGIESYGRIWQESKFPEDPLETYTRLYCNGDVEQFYDDYYDFASRAVTYDFGAIQQYSIPSALEYNTALFKVDGKYRPAYSDVPGTCGFNVIPLTVPASGTEVKVSLSGLEPGSALASEDPGVIVDGDGKTKGTTTTYNAQTNTSKNFRFGLVSVKGGVATYGTMAKGATGEASITVSDCDQLYLVVAATPETYDRHYWNDDESDDEQWPYEFSISGTDLYGIIDIPAGDPEDVDVSLSIACDYSQDVYELGSVNLLNEGIMNKIAVALKLQPSEIAAKMATPAFGQTGEVAEGKVTFGLTETSGSVNYAYTANAGFWINGDGDVTNWGDNAPVYIEYAPSSSVLTYGHRYGQTNAGDKYIVKPTFTYMKDGKEYHAVIELTMQF